MTPVGCFHSMHTHKLETRFPMSRFCEEKGFQCPQHSRSSTAAGQFLMLRGQAAGPSPDSSSCACPPDHYLDDTDGKCESCRAATSQQCRNGVDTPSDCVPYCESIGYTCQLSTDVGSVNSGAGGCACGASGGGGGGDFHLGGGRLLQSSVTYSSISGVDGSCTTTTCAPEMCDPFYYAIGAPGAAAGAGEFEFDSACQGFCEGLGFTCGADKGYDMGYGCDCVGKFDAGVDLDGVIQNMQFVPRFIRRHDATGSSPYGHDGRCVRCDGRSSNPTPSDLSDAALCNGPACGSNVQKHGNKTHVYAGRPEFVCRNIWQSMDGGELGPATWAFSATAGAGVILPVPDSCRAYCASASGGGFTCAAPYSGVAPFNAFGTPALFAAAAHPLAPASPMPGCATGVNKWSEDGKYFQVQKDCWTDTSKSPSFTTLGSVPGKPDIWRCRSESPNAGLTWSCNRVKVEMWA